MWHLRIWNIRKWKLIHKFLLSVFLLYASFLIFVIIYDGCDVMRLRNVKNKEEILNASSFLVKKPEAILWKWSSYFGNSNPILY